MTAIEEVRAPRRAAAGDPARSRGGGELPDPRDRNLSSRDRALAAGLEVLLRHGGDLLVDGLHRKRLAAISAQSRQTYYDHFADHQAYVDEMLEMLLDPTHPTWAAHDLVTYTRDVVDDTPTDSLAIVRHLAVSDFEDLVDDEHWQLVVTAWALARDQPRVRAGLAATWTHYNRRTAQALDELLSHWDATLAPPFDTVRAAHVFAALGEGLAMRAAVLDEIDADLFADTVSAIAHAILRPRGQDRRFEPELPRLDEPPARPLDSFEAERVVALALDAYARDDVAPTFEELARRAGLARSSVRDHFVDTDGLVAAAWSRLYADTPRIFEAMDPNRPVLERFREHLTRLVETALSCPGLNAAFMALMGKVFSEPDRGLARRATAAVRGPLAELIREGRRTGVLDVAVPPPAAAQHLLGTMLGQSAIAPRPYGDRRPEAAPVVETIWSLVVDGWCAIAERARVADDG